MTCPKCQRVTLDILDREKVKMEHKGTLRGVTVWQCPKCKNVEIE